MPPQTTTPKPEEVLKDPKFLQLPAAEQRKVLLKIDKNFAGLPEVEQNLVVSRLHFPQPASKSISGGAVPENDTTGATARTAEGIGRGIKGVVYDMPKGILHAAADAPTDEERARKPNEKRGPGLFLDRVIAQPMEAELDKATESDVKGNKVEAWGHRLAGSLPLVGPPAAYFGERFGSGDIAGTTAEGLTLALLPKVLGKLPGEFLKRYRPKTVDIEGTKFIVPVGEAAESPTANKQAIRQTQYKRAGIEAEQWDEINRYNMKAVKEVIRKVAQKSSGMTGPLSESPVKAMQESGDYVLSQARPIYKALDAAITGTPQMRVIAGNMSKVVESTLKKVEKYGGQVLPAGSATQPLEAYLQARSSILDMMKKTRDPLIRRGLETALDEMNDTVEKEMKSSGVPDMYENFTQANRLWAKGKAIQRVSEALDKASPGVPSNMQPQGVTPRSPEIQAGSLTRQLKKLDGKGDLTRAFGPVVKESLFKVADILDRQSPVGLPPGELELWKSLKHMASGPYRKYMVKVMTTPEGARSIRNLANAYLPTRVKDYALELTRTFQSGAQVQPPPGTSNQPE